ncbi:HAD family hydrolase [Hymenobacter busanensis]|uniref:HAD family hydrolase n=1 Tax=Hymenobacter busanensis TaxID=2607656 RepID=A0A7L5A2X9_9BACT|nr:HAD family hydrolase [Hymenobacter busanensis]KAA9327055.1 HAD family hydrolase [Hymenobacter busanensis]QHJ09506.1 HAD family hydrolase [Hymenobacter busanensis]
MPVPALIAFDADDTLWPNQPHFDAAEARLYALLTHYADADTLAQNFNAVQRENLPLFGYGAKSFMLSMIETVIRLTNGAVTGAEIQQVLDHGKRLLDFPIEPLPHAAEVLTTLKESGVPLMLLTKGDLFDQESKLARSGLGPFFDHLEIVSEKNEATYQRILRRYGVRPEDFVMVGNSLKSDILPVARLGARAVHVPYHTTWVMEEVPAEQLVGVDFVTVDDLSHVVQYLAGLSGSEARP